MISEQTLKYCFNTQQNKDDASDGVNGFKEIKSAASNCENRMLLREWEKEFILERYQENEHQTDLNEYQKCIEISCKLSKYTKKMKENNDPNPPWRTTQSVQNFVNRVAAQHKKKRNRSIDSAESL